MKLKKAFDGQNGQIKTSLSICWSSCASRACVITLRTQLVGLRPSLEPNIAGGDGWGAIVGMDHKAGDP